MRLYLKASSKIGWTYTPDWIKYEYVNPNTNETETITMDIRGEISYQLNSLDVAVKGELVPFVCYNNSTGEEKDFSELDEKECEKYVSLFNQFFSSGTNFLIGVYPLDVEKFEDVDGERNERFSDCSGVYKFTIDGEEREIEFDFDCEINL